MSMNSNTLRFTVNRSGPLECSTCRGTEPEITRELGRLSRIRQYGAGETIIGEQGEISFIGNVVSGVLRTQKTMRNGRQQILGLLFPSDMFGRVFAQVSHVSIEAATQVTVCCYRRASFEGLLARFPALEHRILLAMQVELNAAHDWMTLLGSQTVTERLATFLLMVRRRSFGPSRSAPSTADVVTIPITRKDMAAYLGTTVESICRSIHELSREGAVRIIDVQHFEILDEQWLLRLSGYCDPEADMPPAGLRLRIA